jgi:hypothetical protein
MHPSDINNTSASPLFREAFEGFDTWLGSLFSFFLSWLHRNSINGMHRINYFLLHLSAYCHIGSSPWFTPPSNQRTIVAAMLVSIKSANIVYWPCRSAMSALDPPPFSRLAGYFMSYQTQKRYELAWYLIIIMHILPEPMIENCYSKLHYTSQDCYFSQIYANFT